MRVTYELSPSSFSNFFTFHFSLESNLCVFGYIQIDRSDIDERVSIKLIGFANFFEQNWMDATSVYSS